MMEIVPTAMENVSFRIEVDKKKKLVELAEKFTAESQHNYTYSDVIRHAIDFYLKQYQLKLEQQK